MTRLVAAGVPLPIPDEDTAPYWEAARRHELRIQRCGDCRTYQHFPGPVCSRCGSRNLSFERVSGLGTVYTYTVIHHVVTAGFKARAPYVVAWIELPEQKGLRVLSDLVDADHNAVAVGMCVEVVFDDVDETITVPRFRPSTSPLTPTGERG